MQPSEITRRIRNFKQRFGATHKSAPAILLGDESDRPPGRHFDAVRDVTIHHCESCGDVAVLDCVEVMRGVGDNTMETICGFGYKEDISEEDMDAIESDARILVELFESLDQIEKLLILAERVARA